MNQHKDSHLAGCCGVTCGRHAPLTYRSVLYQVLAQAPTTQGRSSEKILSGTVYPTNAASLPEQQVPAAVGPRADGATPFHAFMWPVYGTESAAAGSISAILYNDSR